jgi:hypothetical protein
MLTSFIMTQSNCIFLLTGRKAQLKQKNVPAEPFPIAHTNTFCRIIKIPKGGILMIRQCSGATAAFLANTPTRIEVWARRKHSAQA